MFFTWIQIQEQIQIVGHNGLIQFLIGLILIDIFTGFIKSFKKDSTSSTTALLGILKHMLVVSLIFLISIYFPLLEYGWVAEGFIIYTISSYGISIAENWALLGLPMPYFVKDMLVKVRNNINEGKDSNE